MKPHTTADRLNQIMNERNIKQVDILEMTKPYSKKYNVKMNKSDLSQYVSGKVEPGQDKLFILARALGVNEAWLMGYDVMKSSNSSATINWDDLTKLLRNFDRETLKKVSDYIDNLLYPSRKEMITWLRNNWQYAASDGYIYEEMDDDELYRYYEDAKRTLEGE